MPSPLKSKSRSRDLLSIFRPFLPIKKRVRWPSGNQWAQVFKILTKKEKRVFLIFSALFLTSAIFLAAGLYLKNTRVEPASGGAHTEGVVGSPRFINPIYIGSNDVDRDLTELLFSGLMKYDGQGKMAPDLADCASENDGKDYKCLLKENIFWHDNQKLTADDVIFTIKTIQNPDYKSPLRANWLGVEIEKINDREILFSLKNSYSAFPERLTAKILPRHIWQDISPQNFLLSVYNLKPVGSGPYQFVKLSQTGSGAINSISLKRFGNYFGKKPYLSNITFRFFDNEKSLIQAANNGELDGFSLASGDYGLIKNKKYQEIYISLPRYFAVFFNLDNSDILAQSEARLALNYGTDKKEILEKALGGKGEIVDSPVLPQIYGMVSPVKTYNFDLDKAKSLLDKAGFRQLDDGTRVKPDKKTAAFQFKSDLQKGSRGDEVKKLQECLSKPPAGGTDIYPSGEITGYFGAGTETAVINFQEKYAKDILAPWGFKKGTGQVSKTTRTKLNELCENAKPQSGLPLTFTLTTVEDPLMEKTANLLKEQWQKLGIKIEIKSYPISQLEQEIIKPRNYEMLLLGEALGAVPDPLPFWHSSQIKDPGLNLSKYSNKNVDKLLEKARMNLDAQLRAQQYEDFQDIVIKDAPAIFLYSPDYIYFLSKETRGAEIKMIIDPSKRFSQMENWYIQTKRAWD